MAAVKKRWVVILVDNGSSHNFINKKLAIKLNLTAMKIEPFKVRVANGEGLMCDTQYKEVPLQIQGVLIKVDLFALPLVGPDVVLGVQ